MGRRSGRAVALSVAALALAGLARGGPVPAGAQGTGVPGAQLVPVNPATGMVTLPSGSVYRLNEALRAGKVILLPGLPPPQGGQLPAAVLVPAPAQP